MRNEYTYNKTEYSLTFQIGTEADDFMTPCQEEHYAVITGCRGTAATIDIPEEVIAEGVTFKVRFIDKKAFLGNGSVVKIIIPATVLGIMDWAFAQCDSLEYVVVKGENRTETLFGRQVFEDSRRLKHICINTEETNSLSALMGAIPCRLPDEHLLSDKDAGSPHWFAKWDGKLAAFLDEEDSEGYTNLALCGEEDIKSDVPEYVAEKRRKKCELCFLRLMNDELLEKEYRDKFTNYILTHKKGEASDDAWQLILLEHGDDMSYYRMFEKLGGINEDNLDAMLLDMGERHAEAKAYLMSLKHDTMSQDIFAGFEL
ncbi:MAG: hypothetical protein ACI4D8_05285 [Wujia sp.]